jgi:hypothetical protein
MTGTRRSPTMEMAAMLFPLCIVVGGFIAAGIAAIQTVRFYVEDDLVRAIFWLLATGMLGRWAGRRLDEASVDAAANR